MDVSSDAFRFQLDWLEENGRLLPIEDALSVDNIASDDVFVLTFDDGHVSLWDHAFPILQERGLPFVLYISTAALEGSGLLHEDPRMPLLTWPQIDEMRSSGLMTIGAHTHAHIDLQRQPVDVVDADTSECDKIIADMTGIAPVHFAYPWGRWSPTADSVVRQRYQTATVGGGPGITEHSDRLRLPRIPVMASDTRLLFERKMWGGFRLETSLRRWRDRLSAPAGDG